jgi:hypothetical protein
MGGESGRRAWCREKAKAQLYGMHNGKTTFEQAISSIVRRWPVVCADPEFHIELRKIWDRETEENEKFLQKTRRGTLAARKGPGESR